MPATPDARPPDARQMPANAALRPQMLPDRSGGLETITVIGMKRDIPLPQPADDT